LQKLNVTKVDVKVATYNHKVENWKWMATGRT